MAPGCLELTVCCSPQELHSGQHRERPSGSTEDDLSWDEAELSAQGPELSVDSHRGNCQPAGPVSGGALEGDSSQVDQTCKTTRCQGQRVPKQSLKQCHWSCEVDHQGNRCCLLLATSWKLGFRVVRIVRDSQQEKLGVLMPCCISS